MEPKNPCTQCGACCSYFRVEFYWREVEKNFSYDVPAELSEEVNCFKKRMKGTGEKSKNRCIALKGKVGDSVTCTIYSNRPTPCRNFEASYAEGSHNARCSEARLSHGLKPLKCR